MTRKRRLSMESLERRIVLDGYGLQDPPSSVEWESVIVALKDDAGDPETVGRGVANSHGGRLGHVYQHALKGFSAQLPAAALESLEKNPHVKRIDMDRLVQATTAQTVPTGIDRIGAEPSTTGDPITVNVDIAIIDTGIDTSHEDLTVVGGRHFYHRTTGPPSRRGAQQDDNYNDDGGHGTHVAGTAAARDNDVGVVGVAPGARLWAVKVLDANGAGYESDIIAGIDWVTANAGTIEVANMSLGWQGTNPSLHTAIQNSVAAGVVYVASSGNSYAEILGDDNVFGNSNDFIPAAYPEVATISAMADSDGQPGGAGSATAYQGYADDTFADFSNFSNSPAGEDSWYVANNPVTSPGLGIDLMLPGVDIYSTYKGGYATMSGTSMAAPHAAGLAALYIAENGRANNAVEVHSIRQVLIDNGKAWRSAEGLVAPPVGQPNLDSPDKHEENLGWVGTTTGNTPPVAVDDAASTEEGTAVVIAVLTNDTDVDGDTLSIASFGSASNGSVTDNGDGTLTYTPVAGFTGEDSFSYTASDGNGGTDTATVTVTVTVTPQNDAPVANDDSYATDEDSQLEVAASGVLGNDTDADGNPLTAILAAGPSNGALALNADGSFSYMPDAGYVGTDSFTYRAYDGTVYSNTATVTITVQTAATMHVGDLDATSTSQGSRWTAIVTIAIDDSQEASVDGATVAGEWGGGISGTDSCTTNASGVCEVRYSGIKKNVGVVTFTVTGVTADSLTYENAGNHDPDGDSDGTIIDVNKPLHAAAVAVAEDALGQPLIPSMLRPAVDAAVAHWAARGVATDRLDTLREADVEIVDLGGSLLGMAYSSWIVLDRDAAGFGWSSDSRGLGADSSAGVDLFWAVTHELGHLLGYEHRLDQHDVMTATLSPVTGRFPGGTQLALTDGLAFWSSRLEDQGDDREESGVLYGVDLVAVPSMPSVVGQQHCISRATDARLLDEATEEATQLIDDALLDLLADSDL